MWKRIKRWAQRHPRKAVAIGVGAALALGSAGAELTPTPKDVAVVEYVREHAAAGMELFVEIFTEPDVAPATGTTEGQPE